MKTIFFLALVTATSACVAKAPKSTIQSASVTETTRLEYRHAPLSSDGTERGESTTILVYASGRVTVTECTDAAEACATSDLATLGKDDMAAIDEKIEKARLVETKTHLGICDAIPKRDERHTAEGGNLILKAEAVPCGGKTWNPSPEAVELVKLLNALAKQVSVEAPQ